MKYIMLEKNGINVPIIFPDALVHQDVASAVIRMNDPMVSGATVVSAGDVSVFATTTHGKSTTLGVVARPNDATIINVWDYNEGYETHADAATERLVLQAVARGLSKCV